MPWSVTLISTTVARRSGGERDARTRRAVLQGVGDQVGQRAGELLPVAVDEQALLAGGDELDVRRCGAGPVAVGGVAHEVLDADDLGVATAGRRPAPGRGR